MAPSPCFFKVQLFDFLVCLINFLFYFLCETKFVLLFFYPNLTRPLIGWDKMWQPMRTLHIKNGNLSKKYFQIKYFQIFFFPKKVFQIFFPKKNSFRKIYFWPNNIFQIFLSTFFSLFKKKEVQNVFQFFFLIHVRICFQ